MKHEIDDRVRQLEDKYSKTGQSLTCHLDGLINASYLNYWDYIHLEILLKLQVPKTDFPDEIVFITYHQICELYFRLILDELMHISKLRSDGFDSFLKRGFRIIRYFENLIGSFSIMSEGIDREEFLKFRTALFPASGFQSVQYRLIEICSTDLINLVPPDDRTALMSRASLPLMYKKLYWNLGAINVDTGKKDITAILFQEKYSKLLLRKAMQFRQKNLWRIFNTHFKQVSERDEGVKMMRKLDELVNITWRLAHYRSAAKALKKQHTENVQSTGGTNWKKYLLPRNNMIMFFPELWSEEEKARWGMPARGEQHL